MTPKKADDRPDAAKAGTSPAANGTSGAPNTHAQRDEATGRNAKSERTDQSYANLKMPHERDETAAADGTAAGGNEAQKEVIDQAARDLKAGLQDTDCYAAVVPRKEKDGSSR